MIKITKDSDPKLRMPSKEVPLPISKENKAFLDEMLAYLLLTQDEKYREKHPTCREGVGLAAPQAGKNLRMIAITYPKGDEEGSIVQYKLVNPKIISNSVKQCYIASGEGCLSVDEEHPGYAYRSNKVVVEAFDPDKEMKITITAKGFDAIVLQHEIDHLNGILFYDRIDKANPFKKVEGAIAI